MSRSDRQNAIAGLRSARGERLLIVYVTSTRAGFEIQMGATPDPWHPTGRYVEAWKTLREFIGKQVDPQ